MQAQDGWTLRIHASLNLVRYSDHFPTEYLLYSAHNSIFVIKKDRIESYISWVEVEYEQEISSLEYY